MPLELWVCGVLDAVYNRLAVRWPFQPQPPACHVDVESKFLMNQEPQTEQIKQAEIDFFTDVAAKGVYEVFQERAYQRILREFESQLGDLLQGPKGTAAAEGIGEGQEKKILDMGCGSGAFTSRMARWKAQFHGIDICEKLIEHACRSYPGIEFSVGDITATEFDDESFDVITLCGALHHFPDMCQVLGECHRVLKPGGRLLAVDPHRGNPIMWAYRCKRSPFYSSVGVTANEEPISKRAVGGALQASGFTQYKSYAISGVTYKHIDSKHAAKILPVYNLIERILDVPPLRQWIGSFLITSVRK